MSAEKSRSRLRKFLPALILLGGILLMVVMITGRKQPAKAESVDNGVLVETLFAVAEDRASTIAAHGTVSAHREIALSSQVGGRIDWTSPRFLSGGAFKAGEVMIRVEEIDYKLAVDQAKAAVAQAEYQYSLAKAQADIAADEWERLGKDSNLAASEQPGPDALVLHGPQLKQAEANLGSARSRLEMAELNLARTSLRAPFDCRIRDEMVDLGQFINAGQTVARIFSTDLVEIEVRLPVSELEWIEIPGSKADVAMTGSQGRWVGYVDRSVGVIDSVGRLARIVVRVEDPFDSDLTRANELTIGAFVDLTIEGRSLEQVVPIPRAALHSDSMIWIAKPDSTLEIRKIKVARSNASEAFVSSGLHPGEQVVLTALSGAADGMRLRPALRGDRQ